MMPQDIAEKVFHGNIPKETLVSKTHPYTKLFLVVFFGGMAWFYSQFMDLLLLLVLYIFIMALSKKNPFMPWFIWAWVALFGYLYYRVSAHSQGSPSLMNLSVYPIRAYLFIAPIVHVAALMNPVELIQVLPNRLHVLGVPILAFSRYTKVCPQQFRSTREAFRLRDVSIRESFFELFITTLIVNIEKHGKKFADNIEIRNLDHPGMLHDKPIAGKEDTILFGVCVLIGLVLVLFVP